MPTSLVLKVSNVSKNFSGTWALRGVSFEVCRGEVHGLVGENGAGKSTLMGIATGALMPDEGEVVIAGTSVSGNPDEARRCGLAIVRQEPALMPDISVAENLYLGVPESKRPPIGRLDSWARDLLRNWNETISIDVTDRVDQMSSEQCFVIEIVKALALDPVVLVLDEPTEHLLAEDVGRLFDRIRAVAAQGTGVVYISHRIREVREITDRITVLRDGMVQGSFGKDALSEHQIVELIVGNSLTDEYPPKTAPHGDDVLLSVEEFSGQSFDRVSIEVKPGEIVGLAGMDGSGKREFIRALAGIAAGTGEVRVNGREVSVRNTTSATSAGVQYLSGARHREGMFAELSVRENFSLRSITSDLRVGIVSKLREARRASVAVADFAIKTRGIEEPIGFLSGGNQQKVLVAGVLAARPKIMLVDEPTQGVDVGARALIYRTLRKAADEGCAVILVSSDAAEIAGLSNSVLVFSRGHIVRKLENEDVTEAAIIKSILTAGSVRGRQSGAAAGVVQVWKWLAGHWAPPAMVALTTLLLGAYAAHVNEFYLTDRNLSGIFTTVATLAIVACAQQILMLIGGIDLSVGPLMGLVVVVESFFLVPDAPFSQQMIGWGAIIGVCVAIGLVNWALTDPVGLHPMIATLSTYMLLRAFSLILRPSPAGSIDESVMDVVNSRVGSVPMTLIAAVILVVALEWLLLRTKWGISFRAFGSRPEAARVSGVPPRAIKMAGYVLCSVIAGVAAIGMMGQVGIGDPASGTDYTLASIAAAVIGGASLFGARGSFVGALAGSFMISQVNVVTTFLDLSDAWQSILLGCMIVLAVAIYSKARYVAVSGNTVT